MRVLLACTGLSLTLPCLFSLAFGQGYAWDPSSLTVSVGDTVRWTWEAPYKVPLSYKVVSIPNPGSTSYEKGPIYSGPTGTAKGRTLSHHRSAHISFQLELKGKFHFTV